MREVVFGADLTAPPVRAFAFVSDPRNWPRFFASMRSAEIIDGWEQPGGRARLVTRFLGMDVVSDLELLEWDPPHAFRFVARQRGRPELDNRRTFTATAGGTRPIP